jgi:hypothetical protein
MIDRLSLYGAFWTNDHIHHPCALNRRQTRDAPFSRKGPARPHTRPTNPRRTPAFEGVTESSFWRRRVIYRITQLNAVPGSGIWRAAGGIWRRTGGQSHEFRIAHTIALASCCNHATAGIASAAAAAIRRRRVWAQPRLSANACSRQTARTFSRLWTRNRNMPRFLMMPCARSVSLRRR